MDSPKQSCINGIFGEPSLLVRVGDKYQVTLPIMCVRQNKHGQENFSDAQAVSSVGLPCLQAVEVEDYNLLPSPANPWTDTEAQSFLLALHFFGKNFVEIRNFIENKEMGDILFYYYGEFYRSDIRRSWLVCRKGINKKCIHGRGIVTGWRWNELLSRLAPMMSTDALCGLQEATKTFNDNKDASFEKYVHTLKAAVGIQALVEAVAIGKGERDLTRIAARPIRKIQVSTHPPIVREISSLTCRQISEFLNGNTRLSKGLSNDIFWGAVWPRLLARGWHLEQPGHLSFVGSKCAFLFLVPGVEEFSRKESEKGTHYFDSVCDVLNKVAADPRLIGIDDEGDGGGSDTKDVYGSDTDTRLDQNGLPDYQDSEAMETLNGDEQTSTTSRRQGTRNRPPTMKVLEAIADGLLGTKRKRRGNDSQSRSSQRVRRRNVEPPSLAQNTDQAAARESNARMDIGYAANGNNERMVGNSHLQSERKEIH